MNKPPAFQFYADDFLAGVADMTQAEVGAYILLLCAQWSRGAIPTDPARAAMIAKGEVSPHVMAKFPGGINPRLEQERQKQAQWRAKQADNGRKGMLKRWDNKAHNEPITGLLPNHNGPITSLQPKHNSPSPSPSPISLEREQGAERPDEREVKAHAVTIGLAEWKALDWFNEMEACGWLDHASRPVKLWKPLLARVKAKWEADGRPAGPPASKAYKDATGANGAQREPSTYELRTRLEEVRKAKQSAKGKAAQAPGGGLIFSRDEDKNEFLRLGRLEKELAAKLIAA